ncbi:MAG TPA: hypothetical protein VMT57_07835 [Candidatus Thermoplasmatota archaeon]|nr:hypothetical protein [Candidatus Thermoplasmatota archaeon]
MKSKSRNLLKAGIVLCIAALFIGTSTAALVQPTKTDVTKAKATIGINTKSSRDQFELKYYNPDTLQWVMGIQGGTPPYVWKTGIRLTQDEMALYSTWTLTAVNVAFGEDPLEGPMDVRIYVYDAGTQTNPGPIIVNDTTANLNGTQIITVPLTTPVPLAGHNELWIAVEYTQYTDKTHYAFLDTGPAVPYKGDWIYLNKKWSETRSPPGSADYNWGIGGVIEGQGLATIAIANVKGPIGIKADIQNTGDVDAQNVTYSMTVTGGLLGRINKTASGTDALLAAHATYPISIPMFFGFGKINIMITAFAKNAVEVTASKSAFVLGPLVIGIK